MDQKLRKGQFSVLDVQTTAAQKQTVQKKIDEEIKALEAPPPLQTTEYSSEAANTDSCESKCTEFEVPKELESKCQNRY